jgi:hypothetical protein
MPKTLFRSVLCLFASVCGFVALFCVWGFLCAFEPGQEAWLTIYPAVFAVAAAAGIASTVVATRS